MITKIVALVGDVRGRTERASPTGDLVQKVYEAGLDSARWSEVLEDICAAYGAPAGMLGAFNFTTNIGIKHCAVGIEPEFQRSYAAIFGKKNPWAKDQALLTPGTVRTGRRLIADESLQGTEFFREWLQPQGLFHSIRGVLNRERQTIWFLGLIRGESAPNFNEAEVREFEKLIGHAALAYRVSRALAEQASQAKASIGIFERLPFGFAMLQVDGRVLAANRLAKQLSAARDGIEFHRNVLMVRRRTDRARLLDMIAKHPTDDDDGGEASLSITRGEGLRPLSMLVSPAPQIDGPFGPQVGSGAVLISDPERRITIDPEALRSAYDLTLAEARVAAGLAAGAPLSEVAVKLGITYETARTYLKRTLCKTETSRQADLIHLVHAGLGRITWGEGAKG